MIELKNIVEDIVLELIDSMDESRSGEINKNQKREIAAYVLNRIRPMYITSNRGFTNLIVKYQNDPQFLADLMTQVNEAKKIIKRSNLDSLDDEVKVDLDKNKLHYILPKIYGKLISTRMMAPVEEAEVALYINHELGVSFFGRWKNPVMLKPRDEGIFSFAPSPILAGSPYQKKVFDIAIKIKKDDKEFEKVFQYETTPSIIDNLSIDFNENILQVEDIYIGL